MIEYQPDPCNAVIDDPAPSPATVAFRLCNFDTGKAELLADHRVELHRQILDTYWPHSTGSIDLTGFASKLKYAHDPKGEGNRNLSADRCAAVQKYLEGGLPRGFRFNPLDPEGDKWSQAASLDAGFYRAVLVQLNAYGYRPPLVKKSGPIPRPPHPMLSASNHFRIEPAKLITTSLDLGYVDKLLFKITDLTNGESRYFLYAGVGLGLALSFPPGAGKSASWGSADHSDIWTTFPIRDLAAFESDSLVPGEAGLTQGGLSGSTGGPTPPSFTFFKFLPKIFKSRGIYESISLKFSFSNGIASPSVGGSGSGGTVVAKRAGFDPGPPGPLPVGM
jgi:hypothetical protein